MRDTPLKNILLISLPTFLLLFLVLEIMVRGLYPKVSLLELTGRQPTENPMRAWARNDSYAAYSAIPGKYDEQKTVNTHGFISTPEIKMEKDSNTTRMIFLGGSSTAGTGVNIADEKTWPWLTAEKLRAASSGEIDFINAALGGYSTFESYGKLWSQLRFYTPDIVIMYHGWNEMYYFNEIADSPISWKKTFSVNGKTKMESLPPLAVDRYIAWSQLLTKVRVKLSRNTALSGEYKLGENEPLKNDFNEKGLAIFRENLRLIQAFCEQYNIELFVCKQATLITSNTSETDRERCHYEFHGFDHDAHVRAFEKIYEVIDQEVAENNIIDLTHLSGVSSHFYDHIHQTELGNDLISDQVYQYLLRAVSEE